MRVVAEGVAGLPEVWPGDDLVALLAGALPPLADGDVVVVTSKVVSKAEGRVVTTPTPGDREAAIDAEAAREVAAWDSPRGRTRVVATRHGLVLAAAGVDASNTAPGTLVLLPEDPDGSARRLRRGLMTRRGVRLGVLVSDTFGRPWREGQVDVAIGAAGLVVLDDLRGRVDAWGNELGVTASAVADEIASAAELVKGKLAGVPVALVRGLAHLVTDEDGPGARVLVRPVEQDMFSLGTREARLAGARDAALREDRDRSGDALARAGAGCPPVRLVRRAGEVVATVPAAVRTDPATLVLAGAALERAAVLLAAEGERCGRPEAAGEAAAVEGPDGGDVVVARLPVGPHIAR